MTSTLPSAPPLAARIASSAADFSSAALDATAIAKVKICLRDLIGCAFEAWNLPWSQQARALANKVNEPGATIIGSPHAVSVGDAAFANAVMGHGLVREDMHTGSISHLGIVVIPTLLALAETKVVGGRDLIVAAVVGYEVGGQVGRAALDAEVARIHRPTGLTGPLAAAAAASRLLRLSHAEFTSALALAANTTLGFNQWAHTGGSEMFFHAGFAARNALTAVALAAAGAFASPTALDGEAGLFAALGKRDQISRVRLFSGAPEILSVYHKPVPACNYAQTATLAAQQLAQLHAPSPEQISAIYIRVSLNAVRYPGCDATGPFEHILQGKMSIQFNVAATIVIGTASERNFALLDDSRVTRLMDLVTLVVDDEFSRAYPAQQGAEVEVLLRDGAHYKVRLADVVNASAEEVRARFRMAAADALGQPRMEAIDNFIEQLEYADDAGELSRLLRAE